MLDDPEDFFHVSELVSTILNFMFEFMKQFGETA